MTYRQLLAHQPTTGAPSEAGRYVATLTAFLHTESAASLPDAHRNYLYRLRAKWQRRADGLDLAWGRARARKSIERDHTTIANATDLDQLSADLIRKYGSSTDDS